MLFDPACYGPEVEALLALDGAGQRLLPLVSRACSSEEARSILKTKSANNLFSGSYAPQAALSGLWLYFSCFDESHNALQDIETPDCSYWHGIVHRQEPDAGNAAYWFRQVGDHPVFPLLRESAEKLTTPQFKLKERWDPFAFIDFCEEARRQPGTETGGAAREIQRVEWQLLFDHCARPRR